MLEAGCVYSSQSRFAVAKKQGQFGNSEGWEGLPLGAITTNLVKHFANVLQWHRFVAYCEHSNELNMKGGKLVD
jgi:hypothetical protein